MGIGRDSDACRLFILNWTENNSIIIWEKSRVNAKKIK